ncbi:hypothetical protein HYH03_017116 [Edaphochlamys debaryana]|uniref:Peroxidase n=1 Tax=Edaphochlamys debaryana TaxID=47281 RepID=A0A835XKP5_9CHLO|nr:hypothetical protein HYH03_017116 [Edaphochlamys debaryana]|eukprot:KAG2484026.1 hypothetical protein HYH03_017116 [Edaphochlamys debaryana]
MATMLPARPGCPFHMRGANAQVATYLRTSMQCSGRWCLDVDAYAASHPDLPVAEIDARVMMWSPKMPKSEAGDKYDPQDKDWASVVSVCRALFQYEKRFASFFIRSSFHDSLAVDVTKCPGPECGGADASLFLTFDELARPENADDNFALITARAAKKIASFFDISVADTMAVCAAVAPEVLSNGRLRILDGTKALRVGRLDSIRPAPPNQLPPNSANASSFLTFWTARGFTPREAAALMGSHCLVDSQGCFKGPGRSDYCDPSTQDCSNVRMFRWENHYYKDICSATLKVREVPPDEPRIEETPVVGMRQPEFDAEAKLETCKFTSDAGRAAALNTLKWQQVGTQGEPVQPDEQVSVTWTNADCRHAAAASGLPATSVNCPHSSFWWYTNNDAYTGLVCQWCSMCGTGTTGTKSLYGYCKSCNDETCGSSTCNSCVSRSRIAVADPGRCCGCSTRVRPLRYNVTSGQVLDTQFISRFADVSPAAAWPDSGLPAADAGPVPEPELAGDPGSDAVAPAVTVGGKFARLPVSPYIGESALPEVCSGASGVRVDGYPASPFTLTPFTRNFTTPPRATVAASLSRPDINQTVDAYELDIDYIDVNLGLCPGTQLTRLLAYNGSVPGPTFRATKGRQSLVRFNNKLTAARTAGTPFATHPPCDTATRQGRPITVHLHGEASLAPYDDNAYYGLAGMYVVTDSAREGGCGEPWNLDNLPDTPMIFKDIVLDSSCQLLYDREGPHKNNLYGDINTVNGVAWPVWKPEARWQRLRWLNAASSRPWKLRIVDDKGSDVSGTICQVIAGDGGIRRNPTAFPRAGLFMGVAERYEVVCDFTTYRGKTLYLWNARDDFRMKGAPFFCNSHLVMRIEPQKPAAQPNPAFSPVGPARPALDAVLSDADFAAARAMVANRQCTRTFKFGRRRGHWVINGESWHTARVAARDVGQNTWELWCLEIGGGWYHPIHIHLVDFYVIARNREESQVYDYERLTPKDVVQLNPGSEVALLTRFGPHRGEYMFHCHNLVHEDFEMMRSYSVGPSASGRMASTALPIQGIPELLNSTDVLYDLYKDPVYPPARARPTAGLTSLIKNPGVATTDAALRFPTTQGLYRIFYPGGAANESPLLKDPSLNPWLVRVCQPQPAAV